MPKPKINSVANSIVAIHSELIRKRNKYWSCFLKIPTVAPYKEDLMQFCPCLTFETLESIFDYVSVNEKITKDDIKGYLCKQNGAKFATIDSDERLAIMLDGGDLEPSVIDIIYYTCILYFHYNKTITNEHLFVVNVLFNNIFAQNVFSDRDSLDDWQKDFIDEIVQFVREFESEDFSKNYLKHMLSTRMSSMKKTYEVLSVLQQDCSNIYNMEPDEIYTNMLPTIRDFKTLELYS